MHEVSDGKINTMRPAVEVDGGATGAITHYLTMPTE